MFHLGMWRERLRNSLADVAEGRPQGAAPPIEQQDEINDAEIANGLGTPLSDAAARADHLLGEIIDLYTKVGDRPFEWYRGRTTTEAVLLNCYTHPRLHIHEYLRENGEDDAAAQVWETGLAELRRVSAPPVNVGTALYNVACVRANQHRFDEAIDLLREALLLRPALKQSASNDPDLAPLLEDPRFQELVKT